MWLWFWGEGAPTTGNRPVRALENGQAKGFSPQEVLPPPPQPSRAGVKTSLTCRNRPAHDSRLTTPTKREPFFGTNHVAHFFFQHRCLEPLLNLGPLLGPLVPTHEEHPSRNIPGRVSWGETGSCQPQQDRRLGERPPKTT
jgi:hypothetical protein